MLPREQRLTKGSEYAAVAQHGRVWRGPLLLMRVLRQGGEYTRFGLVVSSVVGNAVVRNRIKRRLREILRGVPVHQGWDVVLSARPEAASADYHSLEHGVTGLLLRAELLVQGTPRTTQRGE